MDISNEKWRLTWKPGLGTQIENRETNEIRAAKGEIPTANRLAFASETEFNRLMARCFYG